MIERTHADGSRFNASEATHNEYAEYIDLTPSDEGWEQVALRFIDSTRGDFYARREVDAKAILGSLIEIVFYLGAAHPTDKALRDRLVKAATR